MNNLKRGWWFFIHMIHKYLIKSQNFSQNGLGISNNYREWLGQHEPCYDINTWPSLLDFRKALKARLSVWKARASILNTRESDWKARPHVLKQLLVRVFCQEEFLKIWSVKSTVYSLESNLINLHLIFYLHFTNDSWSYSLRHCQMHTNWLYELPKCWFSGQYL